VKQREAEGVQRVRANLPLGDPFAEEPLPRQRTLAEWADSWLAWKERAVSEGTLKVYRNHLLYHAVPCLGSHTLTDLTQTDVQNLLSDLGDGELAATTVRQIHKILKSCLTKAFNDGLIVRNPAVGVVLPQEDPTRRPWTYLSEEELQRVVAAADSGWGPWFLFYARTGLRLGEGVGLKWDCVDTRHRRIEVRRACRWGAGHEVLGPPKSKRSRWVGLRDDVWAWLRGHPSRFRREWVLSRGQGAMVNRWNLKNALTRAVKRADLGRHVRFHDLRHTFASHLVQAGRPLTEVQVLLGHASIVTTQRYAHLAPETTADVVRMLDGL